MNLYEKIDNVLKYYNLSRSELARRLQVAQNTINRYFTPEQQDKLTPYLWKILESFPDVSRDWLFFGEGEMLGKNRVTGKDVDALKEQVQELEKELKESYRHNQRLSSKILVEGSPNNDTDHSSNG